MTESVRLSFNTFPSLVKMYPKMMISKKPSLIKGDQSYPPIQASIEGITVDPSHMDQFSKVCNFQQGNQTLPLPYPHILAAPLHYAILNHKAFPLKLLGLVHISNSITQYRPIKIEEAMDIECSIEGYDETDKGQVFHLKTQVSIEQELVWEETCSFLARKRSNNTKKSKSSNGSDVTGQPGLVTTSWEIPANMGRRFARVSGDINPIHLSDVSAKLFGFKKAIIHGVWSMSRTMAELQSDFLASENGLSQIKLEVNFKLPVFIPCWVSLQKIKVSDGWEFVMKDSTGVKPHMSGKLSRF